MSKLYSTQNELLMKNLLTFYQRNNNLDKILKIINGESPISLRLIDWFATNYSKKHFTVIDYTHENKTLRTKVYVDYKLKLKLIQKKDLTHFADGSVSIFLIKKIITFKQQLANSTSLGGHWNMELLTI